MVITTLKNTKALCFENEANSGRKIFINEDLTQRRAALARDARSLKNNGAIADTWTIYGKVFVKDVHNHVSVIAQPRDLIKYKTLMNRTNEAPASNQVTTDISWTNMTNNIFLLIFCMTIFLK